MDVDLIPSTLFSKLTLLRNINPHKNTRAHSLAEYRVANDLQEIINSSWKARKTTVT